MWVAEYTAGTESQAAFARCRCRHPGPLQQTLMTHRSLALQVSQPMDTDGEGPSNSNQHKGFTLEELLENLQVCWGSGCTAVKSC